MNEFMENPEQKDRVWSIAVICVFCIIVVVLFLNIEFNNTIPVTFADSTVTVVADTTYVPLTKEQFNQMIEHFNQVQVKVEAQKQTSFAIMERDSVEAIMAVKRKMYSELIRKIENEARYSKYATYEQLLEKYRKDLNEFKEGL